MTEQRIVSVVIITCRRPLSVLKRAVESVLNQSYRRIELIIVDDSPDSYEERQAIKDFFEGKNNIRFIAHKENQGACAARNTGLKNATGEFIAFLDDDDEWEKNKIQAQIACMDSETDLVYCAYYQLFEASGIMREIHPQHRHISFDSLILGNYVGSTSFPLIRTDALRNIGGFDVEMQSAQDYDVWLRLIKNGNFKYVDVPLVKYHLSENDQISKHPVKKISGLERLIEKNKSYLMKNKYAYWNSRIRIIPYYALEKSLKECISLWIEMVRLQPFRFIRNTKALLTVFRKRSKS